MTFDETQRCVPNLLQSEKILFEMVLFKYKYVYKVTSNNSSFLANQIILPLFKRETEGKSQLVV